MVGRGELQTQTKAQFTVVWAGWLREGGAYLGLCDVWSVTVIDQAVPAARQKKHGVSAKT